MREITVFPDETDDAPGFPWVVAIEEENCVPDILDRFETEQEAINYANFIVAQESED